MGCLCAATGCVLVAGRLLDAWELPPAGWIVPFGCSALYFSFLLFHRLRVRVSSQELVESWFLGPARSFPVDEISEPTLVKISDDFDLVEFRAGDGSTVQLRSDEAEKLLGAIEAAISASD